MDAEDSDPARDQSGANDDSELSESSGDKQPEESSGKRKGGSKNGGRKKKKKASGALDMATVEGQLASDPGLSLEDAKLQAKREYNRQNAARARVRNKEMVEDLQKKVAFLTKRTEDLQRENEVLHAQVKVLQSQQQPSAPAAQPAAVQNQAPQQQGMDMSSILSLIQGNQQPQAAPQEANPQMMMSQILSGLNPGQPAQQQQQQPNNFASALNQLLGSNAPQPAPQANNMNGLLQAFGQAPANMAPGMQMQQQNQQGDGSQIPPDVLSSFIAQQQQQQQPQGLDSQGMSTQGQAAAPSQNGQTGQGSTLPTGNANDGVADGPTNGAENGDQQQQQGGSAGNGLQQQAGNLPTDSQQQQLQQQQQQMGDNPMLAQLLNQVPPHMLQGILSDLGQLGGPGGNKAS